MLAQTDTERITLDTREVAAMLGVSARHVQNLAARGDIPRPLRLGSRVLWTKTAIERWLSSADAGRKGEG